MTTIGEGLQAVRARIVRAAQAAQRDPEAVRLLAVSKTQPAERVLEAWRLGQRGFGENYVQEAIDKMERLALLAGTDQVSNAIEWHLIGPLQSNKTRQVAERFAWVHTVDREKIARRLSEQRPAGLPPLNILLQVNISGEATKAGVAPDEAPALAQALATLPGLRLRGLMAIPEPTPDTTNQRARFAAVRVLFETIAASGLALDTLSMGMSADLDSAVAEGSTLVRIGTAIFGERNQTQSDPRGLQ